MLLRPCDARLHGLYTERLRGRCVPDRSLVAEQHIRAADANGAKWSRSCLGGRAKLQRAQRRDTHRRLHPFILHSRLLVHKCTRAANERCYSARSVHRVSGVSRSSLALALPLSARVSAPSSRRRDARADRRLGGAVAVRLHLPGAVQLHVQAVPIAAVRTLPAGDAYGHRQVGRRISRALAAPRPTSRVPCRLTPRPAAYLCARRTVSLLSLILSYQYHKQQGKGKLVYWSASARTA